MQEACSEAQEVDRVVQEGCSGAQEVDSNVQKIGRSAQELGRVEQMACERSGNSASEASTRASLEVRRSRTNRLVHIITS